MPYHGAGWREEQPLHSTRGQHVGRRPRRTEADGGHNGGPGPTKRDTEGDTYYTWAEQSSPVLRPWDSASVQETVEHPRQPTAFPRPAALRSSASPVQMPAPRPQQLVLLLAAAWSLGLLRVAAAEGGGGPCELSVERGSALYNFSLAAPTPAHRHGVLSEDG